VRRSARAAASVSADRRIDAAARRKASGILQAFAAGLQQEAAAEAAGRRDGEEGAKFRPSRDWSPERLLQIVRSGDQAAISAILSYALGHRQGCLSRLPVQGCLSRLPAAAGCPSRRRPA
jgi:hypothetical protein